MTAVTVTTSVDRQAAETAEAAIRNLVEQLDWCAENATTPDVAAAYRHSQRLGTEALVTVRSVR